jgi:hypothetical protein
MYKTVKVEVLQVSRQFNRSFFLRKTDPLISGISGQTVSAKFEGFVEFVKLQSNINLTNTPSRGWDDLCSRITNGTRNVPCTPSGCVYWTECNPPGVFERLCG